MSVDEESWAFGKAQKQVEEMLEEFNENAPYGLEHRRIEYRPLHELSTKRYNLTKQPRKGGKEVSFKEISENFLSSKFNRDSL